VPRAAQRTPAANTGYADADQLTITLVKEEEPLQFRLRRLALEPAVPRRLLIGQELHRRESRPYPAPTRTPRSSELGSFSPLTAVPLFLDPGFTPDRIGWMDLAAELCSYRITYKISSGTPLGAPPEWDASPHRRVADSSPSRCRSTCGVGPS